MIKSSHIASYLVKSYQIRVKRCGLSSIRSAIRHIISDLFASHRLSSRHLASDQICSDRVSELDPIFCRSNQMHSLHVDSDQINSHQIRVKRCGWSPLRGVIRRINLVSGRVASCLLPSYRGTSNQIRVQRCGDSYSRSAIHRVTSGRVASVRFRSCQSRSHQIKSE